MAASEFERGDVDSLLERLIVRAEAQDGYSLGHSTRVLAYSRAIWEKLAPPDDDRTALCLGALLHDVGKVAVPAAILGKRMSLDSAEREWVERHPQFGYDLLSRRPELRSCLDSVLGHHERLDGSGYPSGLSGDDIPLHARIVAVADVFDAMTSARPYREALKPVEVMRHLELEVVSGRLDGKIVGALADSMRGKADRRRAHAWAA